jgi:hypothetical protein
MRGNRTRIQISIVIAVVVASLAIVTGASAKFMPEDGSGIAVAAPPATVVGSTNDGFDWGSALAGAGVGIGAALAVGATAYTMRSRSRLAT